MLVKESCLSIIRFFVITVFVLFSTSDFSQCKIHASHFAFHFRRSVGWKAYVMNLGFYILFLVMLTTMTVLLDKSGGTSPLLDIPRFTIVVMSLFHLLKEVFQIWDEVRQRNVNSILQLSISINIRESVRGKTAR